MIAFHVFPILVLLFYFAARLHFTSRHDNCQTAVVVFGTKNHAFADDSFQFARSEISDCLLYTSIGDAFPFEQCTGLGLFLQPMAARDEMNGSIAV